MVPLQRARGRRSAGARAAGWPASRPSAGSSRSAPPCRCRRCCSCSSTASRASSSRWRATACCPQWAAKLHPDSRDPVRHDALHRDLRRRRGPRRRCGRDLRSDEHRDALRVRARQHRRARAARTPSPIVRARSRCRSSGRWRSLGTAACLFIMMGLPRTGLGALRLWLALGLLLYFVYGYRHSRLRRRLESPERCPSRRPSWLDCSRAS